ncbi:MAG TPA: leucine--tRNA ligase, partial [Clostridiales bacterium]|nr:leucine--tRNA ligase [Clostridiales bacterium]
DYVMMNYATGAIMAVPAHDERDYEFANKFGIKIIEVISGGDIKKEAYTGDGVLVNSDFLNDLNIAEAKKKMIEWLVEKGIGTKKVNYRIQDWGFSRQRYWGEPIPMIYCPECGNVPLKEEDLPLTLPKVDHYELSGTGESPLVNIKDWINVKCPICGKGAKREANTMPQWAGSSWYYLRYIDNKNNNELVNKDKENYWMNIDMYVGGAEHATRHLIYARFWHKFLYDIGVVSTDEPFKRLQHVGLVMAEDGRKMSKRFVNVVNPSDVIENFGADTLRLYEMFMGDFKKTVSWSTNGVKGSRRFLERVWNLQDMVTDGDEYSKECESLIHKTIKKVGEDFEEFKFNTAIAMMMTLVNKFYEIGKVTNKEFKTLLTLLNPLTPHITEEIWQARGYTGMIKGETWPKYDKEKLIDDTIEVPIQVNGKLRAKIVIDRNEDEASVLAKARREMEGMLDGKEIVKEIYVGGKIVNMVVR